MNARLCVLFALWWLLFRASHSLRCSYMRAYARFCGASLFVSLYFSVQRYLPGESKQISIRCFFWLGLCTVLSEEKRPRMRQQQQGDAMWLNRTEPEIIRKNQNGSKKGWSTVGQILTDQRVVERVRAKNGKAALRLDDLSKAFDCFFTTMPCTSTKN